MPPHSAMSISIHVGDFRTPHDRTFRASSSVAYSLASAHASDNEGNAPENLCVVLIPLRCLQLAFGR